MTGHSLGLTMMFLGMTFFFVRIVIHNQMQQVIAKSAPPKTNQPLKKSLSGDQYVPRPKRVPTIISKTC